MSGRLVLGVPVIDGRQWMGGAIYVRNLVYCLASLPESRRPHVRLTGGVDPADPYVRELAAFPFVEAPDRVIGRRERILAKLAALLPGGLVPGPRALAGIDVIYPTYHATPPGATAVHWVPDFQHVVLPHFFDAAERANRDRSIGAVAASQGTLVLSSAAAEADFRRFAPDATVRVAIWRFCTVLTEHEAGGRDPHEAYGLPERYIYLPNQFWAHKNHDVAFRALARLAERGVRPTLVCTGQEQDYRNPDFVPGLKRGLAEAGVADQVMFLGLVPRNDQIAIFRRASFVLQPSLFEGWSTVVEDAKALGRPILLSDIPVHREQVEDGGPDFEAELFDPADQDALAGRIESALARFPAGETPERAARAARAAEARRVAAGAGILDILTQARRRDRSAGGEEG
jgi:glycosyltransferase involved in cell wall biosynthesis